jgi:Fic family protein
MVESGESSNRLEGITAPRDRILALVREGTTPQNRSEQEIAGYRDVLNVIHGNHASLDFSVTTILQFHAQMMQYTGTPGGRWKERDNVIIERDADGSRRVRFRPTSARETPTAVALLVGRHDDAVHRDGREPLVVVPLVILDFLCIHPFGDGNGRTSRLLTLLLLYHHGYDVGRYISLERVFEQTRHSYYGTLEHSSQGWHEGAHDVLPWMTYFWGVVTAAYREYEQRVGTIRTGRGAKGDQVRQAVERKLGSFRSADIEAECPGVSHEWVRRVLRGMRDDGLIELRGHGPGARWVKI